MLDERELLDALVRVVSVVGAATPVSQQEALEAAAGALRTAGLDRVRYHQLVEGPTAHSSGPASLYVSWSAGGARSLPLRVGYCIPFSDSTFGRRWRADGKVPVPVTGSDHGASRGSVRHPWVGALDMSGRSWVDIPVVARDPAGGGRGTYPLRGLLCADWVGPEDELSDGFAKLLCVLGQVLGTALADAASPVLARLEADVEAAARRTEDATEVMEAALGALHEALGVATSSLFEFRWSEQRLSRVAVRSEPAPQPGFKETFLPGENLTGRAWQTPEYRAVFDFERLCEQEPELRASPSYDYHLHSHGPVQSVLFAPVATRNPRYLFRLVNNRKHPKLPLFAEEPVLLGLAEALAPLVDARIASRRTAVVSGLLDLIAGGATLDAVMRAVGGGLREIEGVDGFAVVAHREGEERPHFFHGVRNPSDQERRDLLKDDDYSLVFARKGDVQVVAPPPAGLLARLLRLDKAGGHVLVAVPAVSGATRGALLIPVGRGTTAEVRESLTRDTDNFLLQVAAACGQAIEADFVRAQTRGALRALSLVGHELGTPLAILANEVESAVDRLAARAADPAGAELPPSYLEGVKKEIGVQRDVMSAVIQLGALVGRQSDGRVVGRRREVAVWSLVNAALYQVRQEIALGQVLQPSNLYFERPKGRAELSVSCDYGLVRSALVNLYRNAAKYTTEEVARPTVQTRVGHVTTGSGNFVDISVTNHGLHIPAHREDLMFQPFVRLGSDDPDVARRGMGLGLFLAKQVARAHGGSLTVEEHAELPAERGRQRSGVWRTTFRLRLRAGLPEGNYSVSLAD